MSGALAPVLLASGSPRRRELLALINVAHTVKPADIDESMHPGEAPRALAERLAREKAAAGSGAAPHETVVVGSDTIVVVDGDVLGKPRHTDEAAAMLRRLSGRSHTVITGIAAQWRGAVRSDAVEVGVTFRALSDIEIAEYIQTGEPMDKAGAYGIQGYGATIVDRVDGDYFAVMGLPVNRLVRLFEELGLEYRFGDGLRLPS
jgi:septum formation protein